MLQKIHNTLLKLLESKPSFLECILRSNVFLHIGLLNRTRKGLISPLVYYQTKLVSYWMVWICVSVLLGALLTTFLLDSPNTEPSIFGTFKLPS